MWVLLFPALLALGSAAPGPEKDGGVTMDGFNTYDPEYFWLASIKAFPEEAIHKDNPCAGGSPAYSHHQCKKDHDCPAGFSCLSAKYPDHNDCCLTEGKILPYMQCPGTSAPSANKFCHSDSECGEGNRCHKEWQIPQQLLDELEKEHKENMDPKDTRPLDPTGICCSDEDVAPPVMKSCPKGYLATRHQPCGVTLPGCELDAMCMYVDGVFGRCCMPEKSFNDLKSKGFFGSESFSNSGARSGGGGGFGGGGSESFSNSGARSRGGGFGGGSEATSSSGARSRGGFGGGSQATSSSGARSRGGFGGGSEATSSSGARSRGGYGGGSQATSSSGARSGGGFGGGSSQAFSKSGARSFGGGGSESFSNSRARSFAR